MQFLHGFLLSALLLPPPLRLTALPVQALYHQHRHRTVLRRQITRQLPLIYTALRLQVRHTAPPRRLTLRRPPITVLRAQTLPQQRFPLVLRCPQQVQYTHRRRLIGVLLHQGIRRRSLLLNILPPVPHTHLHRLSSRLHLLAANYILQIFYNVSTMPKKEHASGVWVCLLLLTSMDLFTSIWFFFSIGVVDSIEERKITFAIFS